MQFFNRERKKKITLLLLTTVLLVMCKIDLAYPGVDGFLKQRSQTATPGYINAAKQKTQNIINQTRKDNGFFKGLVEHLKDGLFFKLAGGEGDRTKVDLKKKRSSSDSGTATNLKASEFSESTIVDTTKYDVEEYGKGDSQVYQNEQLISEVIDGVRHIYVGFENAGATGQDAAIIQYAINMAEAGDLVLVGSGAYAGDISVKNGVRIYGGYNSDGIRDIHNTATTIRGSFTANGINRATEINGFTLKSTSVFGDTATIEINGCTDALRISNNTLRDTAAVGISAVNSKAIIYNNKIAGGLGFYAGYGFTFILVRTTVFAITSSNSSLTVSNNIISMTHKGVAEINGSSSIYQNNVLANNMSSFTIAGGSTSVIDGNTVWAGLAIPLTLMGSGIGIQIQNGSTPTITNNIFDGMSKVFHNADDPDMTNIFNDGNIVTGDPDRLGIDPSLFSESNEFMDIREEFDLVTFQYTSDLGGRGYSPNDIREDYNRAVFVKEGGAENRSDAFSEDRDITHLRYRRSRNRYSRTRGFDFAEDTSLDEEYDNGISGKTIASLAKGLMKNKESLLSKDIGKTDEAVVAGIVKDTLGESALSLPVDGIVDTKPQEMAIALILASILKDPTEEQKEILSALEAINKDMEKVEGNAGMDGLSKAQDEFIQMFATLLLTQALPDLLKEADISGIRAVFLELNEEKGHVLTEYKKSIKVYYKSVVEELAANIAILQVQGLVSKDLTTEDIKKLPRSEIDKVLREMKDVEHKTEKEEYMLRKMVGYEEQYIATGKKVLEKNMNNLLQNFTRKMNSLLEGEDLAKKNGGNIK